MTEIFRQPNEHLSALYTSKDKKNATTIHGGPGALEFVVEYTFGAVCFASNGRLTMLHERDSMVHGARVKPANGCAARSTTCTADANLARQCAREGYGHGHGPSAGGALAQYTVHELAQAQGGRNMQQAPLLEHTHTNTHTHIHTHPQTHTHTI